MHLINIKEILPTEAECTTKVGQVENTEMKIKTETKTNVKKHVLCHMIRFLILTSVYKCFTSRASQTFLRFVVTLAVQLLSWKDSL